MCAISAVQIDDQRVREDARGMLAPGPSCVPQAPQLKREWSLWPEFGLDPWKSVRPFKGIFCYDVSEFEYYMPSQAVVSAL